MITTHVDADGDAVGSVLGLWLALKDHGRPAVPWPVDRPPRRYDFLPSFDALRGGRPALEAGDVVVALDAAAPDRLPEGLRRHWAAGGAFVVVDHHASNPGFGGANWVDGAAPATCAMVYELLREMGWEVSSNVATCLYSGLLSDTGNFSYNNTGERAFRVAAALAGAGADAYAVAAHLEFSYPVAYFNALGSALARMRKRDDGTVYTYLLPEELRRCWDAGGEPEGIVDYARKVKGCRVGVLFIEQDNGTVRVSFRANGAGDVRVLAESLGGGGHAAAAGATVPGKLTDVIADVLGRVEEWLRTSSRV